MKTIICANYQKDYIYADLAEMNQGIVTDVQVVPLTVAMEEKHSDRYATLLEISHVLQSKQENFPVYRNMFRYPSFIQEIFHFTLECIRYQISSDDLPCSNEQEKELREIVCLLLEMNLVEKENIKNYMPAIEKLKTTDVEIYPYFEADPYYADILRQFPSKQESKNEGIKHLRYALSTRREIEAIAQDICIRHKPCNIVLTSWKTQYPVLQQVFSRYEIPYSTVHNDTSTRLLQRFIALAKIAYHKNKDSLLAALAIDAFGVDDQRKESSLFAVLKYLDQIMTDIQRPAHISAQLRNSSLLKKESDRYARFEKKADQLFDLIQADLDLLLQSSGFEEILMNTFEIVREQKILQIESELNIGRQLRSILQSFLTAAVHGPDDIPFVLHLLSSVSLSKPSFTDTICTVTDLNHPVKKQDISYIVGCSGKNYPAFPVRNGLFDEDYLSRLSAYPTMKKRHSLYMHALSWTDRSASEIFYSYSTNDYQGKEMQLSYEVQSKIDMTTENIPWPIAVKEEVYHAKHTLDPAIAKQLFLDEHGRLNGSVSAVESYYRNPYGYFIQKGLGIAEQEFSDLDPITSGNIQHHFLYTLLSAYKQMYPNDPHARKQYALQKDHIHLLTVQQIKQHLTPYFDALKLTHPNQCSLYDISLTRMSVSMSRMLSFMHDMETDSSFAPAEFEYPFKDIRIADVVLHGVIDRIDTYNHLIRIIDYKSTPLTISEAEVKQGLRLQMLTYLMAVSNNLHQNAYEPTAVQYLSFRDETIDLNRCHSKYGEMPKALMLKSLSDEFIKSRKMSAWIFNQHQQEVDQYAAHIKSPKDIYDFDKIRAYLMGIYDHFYHQVLLGNIPLAPLEGTSLPYMPLYHFNGVYRTATAIETEGISVDTPFKLDKEETAAKEVKPDENL